MQLRDPEGVRVTTATMDNVSPTSSCLHRIGHSGVKLALMSQHAL